MQFTTAIFAIILGISCVIRGWALPASSQKNTTVLTTSPFVAGASDLTGTAALPAPAFMNARPAASCTQPTLTSDDSKWSSEDDIRKKMENPLQKAAVVWSGSTGGASVLSRAETCAEHLHAQTLGMSMCGRHSFTMPATGVTSEKANRIWDVASQVFAENAVEAVFVIFGDSVNPQGTWARIEFPTLRANKKVQSVIQLNRETCAGTCFWICTGNHHSCKNLKKCPNAPRVGV